MKKKAGPTHLASARNYFLQVSRYTRANRGDFRLLWKVLLSGYIPQYLYERAAIDTSLPLRELKRRSHINATAQAANVASDFSQLIRVRLPAAPKLPAS
jgi:hypothetical protein